LEKSTDIILFGGPKFYTPSHIFLHTKKPKNNIIEWQKKPFIT